MGGAVGGEATETSEAQGSGRESVARTGLFVLLACYVILAFGTGERDLFDADEGRYATVAWNMMVSEDLVTPRLNGMEFMDKPPLVYWIQVPLYWSYGDTSEFIARTPTVLAGTFWCLFIFLFAHAWTGSRGTGWLSALLAATSAAGMIGSRVGPQMDMPLAAAVAGALWAGWCGIQGSGLRARIGLGIAVGLGLLIKGPLVVAVPGLVAVAWMLAGVEPRRIVRVMFSPVAWGVALGIAAPWYIAVERANPGWIQHFIEYEHFGRFNEGDHRSFRPLWFYVPITLLYMLPWASLAWSGWGAAAEHLPWWKRPLGLATWSPWSQRPWRDALPAVQGGVREGRHLDAGRLAWCWFLAAFVLYSLASRKLLNYLLPASAPLFVLLGAQLAHRLRDGRNLPWRVPLVCAGVILAAGVFTLAGLWFPLQTGRLPTDLELPRWQELGTWLVVSGAILAAGVGLVALMRKRAPRIRVAVLVGSAMLAWWSIDHGMARGDHLGSSRRLAEALDVWRDRARAEPGPSERGVRGRPLIVAFKRYPQGLGFYYKGPHRLLGNVIDIAGGTPDAPAQREIVARYARPYFGVRDEDSGRWGPPTRKGANGGWYTGWLWSQQMFEDLWADARLHGDTEPQRILAIVRWREIAPLGAYILDGPFAGAGRTDLFIVSNRPMPPPR